MSDEKKIDGVFADFFVKDLRVAEKLRKEHSDFMERKQTKEQKELQKKMPALPT